jgi:hypothetical protein
MTLFFKLRQKVGCSCLFSFSRITMHVCPNVIAIPEVSWPVQNARVCFQSFPGKEKLNLKLVDIKRASRT